ncbi:hypothetical protein CYLTODRAFT_490336 [Cylindrobasidium torrendii FP15055 ss-10]|uniref:SET domain-containing protein n=1 Tax=Cylindrobasidium torrendii FP15055 ss-10 TaxID=1314674 RepID=A0A0D7BB79_9AGAR|nr:hypothetical protein CYLTODRAFT_490336 [Cylindrobasidium torrendii FP15055 ss-10]
MSAQHPSEYMEMMRRLGGMAAGTDMQALLAQMSQMGLNTPNAQASASSALNSENESALPTIEQQLEQVKQAEERWKIERNASPVPFQRTDRRYWELSRAAGAAKLKPGPAGNIMTFTTMIGQDKYHSSCPLSKLKPITLRQMSCYKRHEGRYLVCRTFLPPVRLVAVELFVEDTNGDTMYTAVYNLPELFQASLPVLESHYPVGTVLAIREPWMKKSGMGGTNMMLRVDSSSDIIILSPTSSISSDAQWSTTLPAAVSLSLRDADAWKAVGNSLFKQKHYLPAVRAWTFAYRMEPTMYTAPLNRAQAYLKLGWASAALADALLALRTVASNEQKYKAVHRAATAEYALGLYAECSRRCEEYGLLHGADELAHLKSACTDRLREAGGRIDMVKLYEASLGKAVDLDVADYVSPSICLASMSSRGGGRGIRATHPVIVGDLLMLHKPFAAVRPEDLSSQEYLVAMNFATKVMTVASNVALIGQIIGKLVALPVEDARRVTDLYAGPSFPSKSSYDLLHLPTAEPVPIDPLSWRDVDVGMVDGIMSKNAFSLHPLSSLGGSKTRPAKEAMPRALYTAPSLFNHSCDPNAVWTSVGTTIVIRAVKNIRVDEEITIPYVSGTTAFERSKTLRGFFPQPCGCDMCVADRQASDAVLEKREVLLNEMTNASGRRPDEQEKFVRAQLKKILSTYPNKDTLADGTPHPVLTIAYASVMKAVQKNVVQRGGKAGAEEIIRLAFKILAYAGFKGIDTSMTSAPGRRFSLPLSKRCVGVHGEQSYLVHVMLHIAENFLEVLAQGICAERWYRAAWWAHNVYYGGGKELFALRLGQQLWDSSLMRDMEYRWD